MPRKKPARKSPRRPKRSFPKLAFLRRWYRLLCLALVFAGAAGAGLYGLRLDRIIREKFEGKRWTLAARVFGRNLELYPGARLTAGDLSRELGRLRYHEAADLRSPGTYRREGGSVAVRTRSFRFWDGEEPSRALRISFERGSVRELLDLETRQRPALSRLDPPLIGSIYPANQEDRILVRLAEVPRLLVDALVAVEDRNFQRHPGLDPVAVVRAAFANLRARGVVQGGSTLTQQLVKNYFLSSERNFRRKIDEAAMAFLLELHYGKEEILEAYLNEVYLGQQGSRAVHGFGLGSQFYFDLPVSELDLPKVALLVGMLRGPSYYDPRRHPDRAIDRRNRVIETLVGQGIVSPGQAAEAQAAPLGVAAKPADGKSRYPAFMDLVQRQLRQDYRDEDLRSEGLRVFATLDPRIQEAAEQSLTSELDRLERGRRMQTGTLQGAAVVARYDTGEVLAVVGGRDPLYAGFNRALDASRPIGSLVKPAVYLTALERPGEYTLATRIEDAPLRVENPGGEVWSPKNYDGQSHGEVTLYEALIHSYNQSTARLGLRLGLPNVADTLKRLGVERPLPPYPSLLLGATELSPLEVAQVYQSLASGGFRAPLRAIREVNTADGQPIRRYPLAVQQVADPGAVFLLNAALQGVVRAGTAKPLLAWGAGELGVAGKTGTTDELRDSWFAGFTGDWVGVAWVGRDDNQPTGLTGATGALRVWGELLRRAGGRPLEPTPPGQVEYAWVRTQTAARGSKGDEGALKLPFLEGSAPRERVSAAQAVPGRLWERLVRWFGEVVE